MNNEWMNEWRNEHMNEWKNEQMNEFFCFSILEGWVLLVYYSFYQLFGLCNSLWLFVGLSFVFQTLLQLTENA